jgi:hypothetical protein
MTDTIQWPQGEFTLLTLVNQNRALAEKVVRQKLAEAITAKAVVQTKKGDKKVKGQFKVIRPMA